MDTNLANEQQESYHEEQPVTYYKEPPKKKSFFFKFILPVLVVVLIAGAGAGYYFYNQTKTTPQDVTENEIQTLIATVSKLIVLPTNETPTVATVSDPSKLISQPFFANSQKGDKVLIYSTSKKAILYRPSTNKIIEVAPINIGTETPTPSATPTPTPVKR